MVNLIYVEEFKQAGSDTWRKLIMENGKKKDRKKGKGGGTQKDKLLIWSCFQHQPFLPINLF